MNNILLDEIYKITNRENVLIDEPMSKHTTFKVGGKADFFIIPNSEKEAADIVRLLLTNEEAFYVIGNGSNLLVSDEGFRGIIVCLSKGMDEIKVSGNEIKAGAGAMLSKVSSVACENSLAGMEFASGIPGSVGGAITMNAGAYGGEMKDIVREVTLFDKENQELVTFSKDEMDFAYRYSIVKSNRYIVMSVIFALKEGNRDAIRNEMNDLNGRRREKQPLEYPSAGSTFKRPEGFFAGKLIEDSGLKGYRVGGAQVSVKHSGFVINYENATAKDIITLIRNVRQIVNEKYNVMLEPEVCMLGEGLEI